SVATRGVRSAEGSARAGPQDFEHALQNALPSSPLAEVSGEDPRERAGLPPLADRDRVERGPPSHVADRAAVTPEGSAGVSRRRDRAPDAAPERRHAGPSGPERSASRR